MKIEHNRHTAVMHVSATKMSIDYTVERLERDHRARGFNGIGYHYYIDKHGTIHKCRPLTRNGAHVSGHNKNTIGICCEGGIGEDGIATDTMTDSQQLAVEGLLLALKKGNPSMKVKGHRDYSPDLNGDGKITKYERIKECPCYDAEVKFAIFNKPLEEILKKLRTDDK